CVLIMFTHYRKTSTTYNHTHPYTPLFLSSDRPWPGVSPCLASSEAAAHPRPGQQRHHRRRLRGPGRQPDARPVDLTRPARQPGRSEEHTSELQSRDVVVCRILIEHIRHLV